MNSKVQQSVLILDADFAAALAILRSLSRQSIACDIGSAVDQPLCIHSRYARDHFQYPDPLTEQDAFVQFIDRLIKKQHYDLVIPVTERSLIPLSESPLFNNCRERLAIAQHDSLIQVLDKAKTLELAQANAISVPFSHPVSRLDELDAILSRITYPVVLKPGQSIPDARERRQLSVSYAYNEAELVEQCRQLLPSCQLLIQEYAQGVGTGIELLADHGEIVYAFQHQRLHELPLTGGGSCLRKSIPVDASLLEASRKLIKALNWHGVAMVEFKWQPETGKYWLMEINGRFWGSLPLACYAGADFPKMLFDLSVNKQRPVDQTYKTPIYCRKLSSDLYWLEQVLRRSESSPLVEYPSHKQIFLDFLWLFHPTRHFFDIQCWYDPLPGLIDLYTIFQSYGKRLFEILESRWLKIYHASAWQRRYLQRRLKSAHSILFLCYGNINRSALAQVLAQQLMPNSAVTFDSAGFHTPANRPADPNMVKTAQKQHIDLSHWQSQTLNGEMIANSDLILAMEIRHLERLKQEYPEAKNKCFLLGSLISQGYRDVEIDDPYNQPIPVYEKTFDRINQAIQALSSLGNR